MEKMAMPVFDCAFFNTHVTCWSPYFGKGSEPPLLEFYEKFNLADMELTYQHGILDITDLDYFLELAYPSFGSIHYAFDKFTYFDIFRLVMENLNVTLDSFPPRAQKWYRERSFVPLNTLTFFEVRTPQLVGDATFVVLKGLFDTWEPLLSAERIESMSKIYQGEQS